jgi:Glycosyltransferase
MTLAPLDSAIIASSTATRRIYEACGVMRGRIRLIYYGFPFDPFDPALDGSPIRREFGIAPDAPLVTMIAYMYSPLKERSLRGLNVFDGIGLKGHEILIEAAAHVRTSLPDVRFLIVGDALVPGEAERYKQKLHRMVADLELQQTVLFAGKRTDIPAILAASDVAAVPSLSENVGGAVEPLLMERPVVASAVAGCPTWCATVKPATWFRHATHSAGDACWSTLRIPLPLRVAQWGAGDGQSSRNCST